MASGPNIAARYGAAAGLTALALVVRLAIDPWLGAQLPYISFFAAVAATGYFAGLGPTVLSIGLGLAAAGWFVVEPHDELHLHAPAGRAGAVSYLVVSAAIAALSHHAARARARARRASRR